MKNEAQNIEIEKKIGAYLRGDLTENQAQKLWVELLKYPEYIERLQTEIDISRYYRHQTNEKGNYSQYWHWFASAAAVILIVAGINIFSSGGLKDHTIDTILLNDNLATANVMRSAEPNFEIIDSVLNTAFENALNSKFDEALTIYNEVIAQYPETVYAAKAFLNIGIIAYNSGEFEKSVARFKKAASTADQNTFIKEQATWYWGNALINTGQHKQAREVLQQTYQLNGVHRNHAARLLEKLNEKLAE